MYLDFDHLLLQELGVLHLALLGQLQLILQLYAPLGHSGRDTVPYKALVLFGPGTVTGQSTVPVPFVTDKIGGSRK
jgi:hypothetical protein